AAHRRAARRLPHAGRRDAAGVLQRARRDARDDHGVLGRRAARRRRLRQLRAAAADRRARHGLPAHQHGELLELLRGRLRDARELPSSGQTWWLFGMVFLITSSLLGSINFIVTTIQLRAPGLTFWRLPFFCWAQFVT